MALTIYIPDVTAPLTVADENLSTEEVRASLATLYPVVDNATATRNGNVIRFARAQGGTKGR